MTTSCAWPPGREESAQDAGDQKLGRVARSPCRGGFRETHTFSVQNKGTDTGPLTGPHGSGGGLRASTRLGLGGLAWLLCSLAFSLWLGNGSMSPGNFSGSAVARVAPANRRRTGRDRGA